MPTDIALETLLRHLDEAHNIGPSSVNVHLRDWGAPDPLVMHRWMHQEGNQDHGPLDFYA